MRLFNLLKKAFYKLGLITDFIVEVGESDSWKYIKYNSGLIKLYGQESFETGRWLGSSILYYDINRTTPLPFALESIISVKYVPKSAEGAVVIPCNQDWNANCSSVSVYYVRAYGGSDSRLITHTIEVTGYWKLETGGG